MFQWVAAGMVAAAMTSTAVAQDKPADTQLAPAKAAKTLQPVIRKMDANNDGKATAAERQARIQEWFKELDANGDGKLTADEFQGQRFVNIDINKNGTITLEEYLLFFVCKECAAYADKQEASDKMDANGDNEVTSVEVVAYQKSVFTAMDADGCGKVTPSDMKAANDKQFKGLDTNHDGFVTVEEMVAIIAVPVTTVPKAVEKKADQPAK